MLFVPKDFLKWLNIWFLLWVLGRIIIKIYWSKQAGLQIIRLSEGWNIGFCSGMNKERYYKNWFGQMCLK